MTDINNARDARINLATVNRALAPIGYEPFAGPDLTGLPNVTEPTPDEIHTAITSSKGAPEKSAAVQALATRAWLSSTGAAKSFEWGAEVAAWETCKAALPAISDEIREKYADVAERLREAATGPFKGTADLKTLDLHSLPTPLAKQAGAVIEDYREAVALHGAWRSIWATLQGGAPAHWSEMATPSNHDYRAARDATPQRFPTTDPWSVARLGWTGALPESLRAAQQRRADYQTAAVDTEQEAARISRRRALAGGSFL